MIESRNRAPRADDAAGALFGKILVATDGSGPARAACRAAADLAQRSRAELHVVHVWNASMPGTHLIRMPSTRAAWCEQKAGELISSEVELIEDSGARVEGAHSTSGDVAGGICSLAREIGAHVLVVGSRNLGLAGRLADGSVSERVARLSLCPVLLTQDRAEGWPPARVVAGVDFSEDSLTAARFGAALGRLYDAPTLLVNAHPPLQFGQKALASGGSRPDSEVRKARELLVRVGLKIEDELGEIPDVKTVLGDPGASILAAAGGGAQPVLAAVGSRGLGTLGRLASGSVSTAVMRGAPGPVLVYRQ